MTTNKVIQIHNMTVTFLLENGLTEQACNVVYCLIFPDGKRYVGQTTRSLIERVTEHCVNPSRLVSIHSKFFNSFKVQIIAKTTVDLLNSLESDSIRDFNTTNYDFGLNISSGNSYDVSSFGNLFLSLKQLGVILWQDYNTELVNIREAIQYCNAKRYVDGKQSISIASYFENETSIEYVRAALELKSDTEVSVEWLKLNGYYKQTAGVMPGVWVHPLIAIDIVSWLSPVLRLHLRDAMLRASGIFNI